MSEQAIANLVHQCAQHLSHGRWEAAADLFKKATVRLGSDEPPLTRDELMTFWEGADSARKSSAPPSHLVANPVIVIDKGKKQATCESDFLVLQPGTNGTLQMIRSGRCRDEFSLGRTGWQFSVREYQCLTDDRDPTASKASADNHGVSSANPLRARILQAAQQTFSSVGYSEAGIRGIADMVGVSPTILFRHFGTKANLFEAALVAIMETRQFPAEKEGFGQRVAQMLADPTHLYCPHAMTVMATGNEEARNIVAKVLEKYAVKPIGKWLGPPHGEIRARQIMALCAGFALYHPQLTGDKKKGFDPQMTRWLADSIQKIVDQS